MATLALLTVSTLCACPCSYRGQSGAWCIQRDNGPLAGIYCMLHQQAAGLALPREVTSARCAATEHCPLQRCTEGASYTAWSACTALCAGVGGTGGGRQERMKLTTTCADFKDRKRRCRCRKTGNAFTCPPLDQLSPLRFTSTLCVPRTRRVKQFRTCNSRKRCSCAAVERPAFARIMLAHATVPSLADRRHILRTLQEAGVQLLGFPHCAETRRQLRLGCGGSDPPLCIAMRALLVDCGSDTHVSCARVSELPSWTVPGQKAVGGVQAWAGLSAISSRLIQQALSATSSAPTRAPTAPPLYLQLPAPTRAAAADSALGVIHRHVMHAEPPPRDLCAELFGGKVKSARTRTGLLEAPTDPFNTHAKTSSLCSHNGYLVVSLSSCKCKCRPPAHGALVRLAYTDAADCRW